MTGVKSDVEGKQVWSAGVECRCGVQVCVANE